MQQKNKWILNEESESKELDFKIGLNILLKS